MGTHTLMFISMTGVFLVLTFILIPVAYINDIIYFIVEEIPLGLIILGAVFSLIISVSTYFFVKGLLEIKPAGSDEL